MKWIIILIAAIVLGLLIAASFFFTVDESEYAVLTQFGNPIKTLEQAGLQHKLPWQTVKIGRASCRERV